MGNNIYTSREKLTEVCLTELTNDMRKDIANRIGNPYTFLYNCYAFKLNCEFYINKKLDVELLINDCLMKLAKQCLNGSSQIRVVDGTIPLERYYAFGYGFKTNEIVKEIGDLFKPIYEEEIDLVNRCIGVLRRFAKDMNNFVLAEDEKQLKLIYMEDMCVYYVRLDILLDDYAKQFIEEKKKELIKSESSKAFRYFLSKKDLTFIMDDGKYITTK